MTQVATDPILAMRTLLTDHAIVREIEDLYDLLGDAEYVIVDHAAMDLLQSGIDTITTKMARRQQELESMLWQIVSERNEMAQTILEQDAHITDLLFGNEP